MVGPVPVTGSVKLPSGEVALVVMVNWEVADPFAAGVTEMGFSEQVVLAGQPETVRPTALLNPFKEVTVMVELADWPCPSVNDDGWLEIKKSGVAVPLHPVNLKDPITVFQLKLPSYGRYSLVYQNVQSSVGSMRNAL